MKHDFLLYMKILTLSNDKLLQEEFEYIGKNRKFLNIVGRNCKFYAFFKKVFRDGARKPLTQNLENDIVLP